MRVGVLGLGEAGSLIAADLRAAGVAIRGYDPKPGSGSDCAGEAEAAAGAGIVLSLTTAAESETALRAALDALAPGQVYADLNTASASLKARLAALVEPTGARFVDVALMAPVPGKGLRTPALAAGPGARVFVATFGRLGMPVELVDGEPGEAARRKLLRSVAWKGLAAVVIEATTAARAAGLEDWMRAELESLLADADIDRMVSGSVTHAQRRAHEMADVAAQLRELGVEPRMSEAARGWLDALVR